MVVFSLLPAFQAMRAQVSDTLRQSGRTLTARPAAAVAAQRAGDHAGRARAGAAVRIDACALTAADRTVNGVLGFDKSNVLVAQLNLPERSYAMPRRGGSSSTG